MMIGVPGDVKDPQPLNLGDENDDEQHGRPKNLLPELADIHVLGSPEEE